MGAQGVVVCAAAGHGRVRPDSSPAASAARGARACAAWWAMHAGLLYSRTSIGSEGTQVTLGSTFNEVFSTTRLSYSTNSEASARPSEELCDERRREIFVQAKQIGGREGAVHLHRHLPPIYWGVNHKQLRAFVRDCRRARLTNAAAPPLAPPPPDSSSIGAGGSVVRSTESFGRVGPSIYQVCEQFLLPRTGAQAWPLPFASSALGWNHTEGLVCSFFISHAWSAGLWEFADVALEAWPSNCTGAYICFLSNPQHLRELLREMLAAPDEAPFRRVLRGRAVELLVLANSGTLVHRRLWCIFEAHCATELGIPVRLVGDPELLSGGVGTFARQASGEARAQSTSLDGQPTWFADSVSGGGGSRPMLPSGARVSGGFKVDVRQAQCSDAHDHATISEELAGHEDAVGLMFEQLITRAAWQAAEVDGSSRAGQCTRLFGAHCVIL
eukprot:NODE_689_length_1406_cov_304.273131.p2 GENE.NODE_689_length_1406_cov_304.273131~~NODE_689_length_1406_cov_304.273131.p2  ORF type:complete len:443 (-),score=135.47 NODE_689_length_1406_cov_304.273131:60-1388(-)